VIACLEEQFNPSGIDKTVNLHNELAAVLMGNKEDPNNMIDQLELIKWLLNEEVPEKILVARALVIAPKEYGAVLIAEKISYGDKLTLDLAHSCMNDVYAVTYRAAAKKRKARTRVNMESHCPMSEQEAEAADGSLAPSFGSRNGPQSLGVSFGSCCCHDSKRIWIWRI
jgi:hypothetical protein